MTPPKLSYKSRAEREREERERRELEEQERRRREREGPVTDHAREPTPRGPPRVPEVPRPPAAAMPVMEVGSPVTAPPAPGRDVALFEEDALGITRDELSMIEVLGAPEEPEEPEEEAASEEPGEVEAPKRSPPHPPRSPDMRPVWVGFVLVATGLVQFIWGLLAMWESPDAYSGIWSPLLRWGAFSMGFAASFLGLLAIRGGLWSFRKERFDVVKVGAIAATVCVWAWWVPWLFGAFALLVVQRARSEYYPHYDPRWDAPSWAPPPAAAREAAVEVTGGDEGTDEGAVGEEAPEVREPTGLPRPVPARDFLDSASSSDVPVEQGVQEAQLLQGDGWEDLA